MAESTRERLINTAQTAFYTHGFHAVGLDRILSEVGVTKTTFYNHFESKDDLIIAVLKEHDVAESRRMIEGVEERASEPRAQILAIFDLLEEWFDETDFRGCMFINAAAAFPALNDPIHKVAAEHNANISEYIRQLAEQAGAADPADLADKIMVVLTGSIVTRHASLNPSAASIARRTVEMLLEHHLPPVPV